MGFFSSIFDGVVALGENVIKYEEEGKGLSIEELCDEVNKDLLDVNLTKRTGYTSALQSKIKLMKNMDLQCYMEEYKGVGSGAAYDLMIEEYNRRNQ